MEATSLANVDTVYSADAVEFCPGRPNLLACGTYQVVKDEDAGAIKASASSEDAGDEQEAAPDSTSPDFTRYGRCLLYEVGQDGRSLKELQRFDGPAILDMKWSPRPRNDQTMLAIANAKGRVQFHALTEDATEPLKVVDEVECADESTLCLSLEWSTRRSATSDPASIVVSLSSGEICLLEGENSYEVTTRWHAHDFEPWIAAFDCWESTTVWTGGDDLTLKGWDLRQGCDRPTFVNKRTFEGGVTSIQSHIERENLFAVGSYDSRVRLFDKRKPLTPLTEFDAGGGNWRLKWHPTDPTRLLVAGMHGGFKVVDFDGLALSGGVDSDGWLRPGDGKLHARFDGHESLAYGADWSDGGRTDDGKDIVASCSFYDHALHVWAC